MAKLVLSSAGNLPGKYYSTGAHNVSTQEKVFTHSANVIVQERAVSVVLRVAVVGAGLMGQWHCHFAKQCGAEIVAVVDPESSRGAALAGKFGCTAVFTSLDEMLNTNDANIVHICTPTRTHQEIATKCVLAGRHVLLEKPVTETVESTRSLLELARTKNVLLNPIHQFGFQRGFREMLEHQERLGSLVRADFITCSAGGTDKAPSARRDVMLEILPHPTSLFYRIFGSAFHADSMNVLRFTDDELELAGNVMDTALSIVISLRGRPTRNQITVTGDLSSAFADLFHGYVVFERGEVSQLSKVLKPLRLGGGLIFKAGTNLAKRALQAEAAYPGLKQLFAEFYEAVELAKSAPISNEEMIVAAQLIDKAKSFYGRNLSPAKSAG